MGQYLPRLRFRYLCFFFRSSHRKDSRPVAPDPAQCSDQLPEYWQPPGQPCRQSFRTTLAAAPKESTVLDIQDQMYKVQVHFYSPSDEAGRKEFPLSFVSEIEIISSSPSTTLPPQLKSVYVSKLSYFGVSHTLARLDWKYKDRSKSRVQGDSGSYSDAAPTTITA